MILYLFLRLYRPDSVEGHFERENKGGLVTKNGIFYYSQNRWGKIGGGFYEEIWFVGSQVNLRKIL